MNPKGRENNICIVFMSSVPVLSVRCIRGEMEIFQTFDTSLLPESKRAKHAYNVCGENNCHENNGIIIITIII